MRCHDEVNECMDASQTMMGKSASTNQKPCSIQGLGRGTGLSAWWTGRIFWKGYHHTLDEADVYDVLPQDSTVKLSNNLGREWEKELYRWKTGGHPSLLSAVWRCYRPQILAFSLLVLVEETLRVVQAILMGHFIQMFHTSITGGATLPYPDAYIFGAFLCVVFLVNIFLDHNFFHHGYRMRVAATSLIYRKVMRLSYSALTPKVMEDIINLVTREMDVFPMVVLPATYILIGPLQLGIVCYLLWDWLSLGPVCMAGIFVLFLLFPLQILMGKLSRILRQKTDTFTGHRLKKLQSIIGGIQELKTGCWERLCEKVLTASRDEELIHMRKLSRLLSFNSALTLTAGKLVMFVTFMLVLVTGRTITAMQIFTAMALFETLRISLSILLPAGILFLNDTLKTLKKIQHFLMMEEKGTLSMSRGSFQMLNNDVVVRFSNYFGSREKSLDAAMVLVNIELDIEKSKLYAVVGPPDGGKSCLLLAVIGELERHKGQLFHHGRLAYIPRQPWLFPGTIRENVVFGSEFVRHRYNQVLQSCALSQMLDAFPQGDLTVVGDRGVAIDNSVQAKITLARAVYQNADIYLIDDILSGMDGKSSMHIFKKCICGLLQNKTRLFVTDNAQHTQMANNVIMVSQGAVHFSGRYDDIHRWGISVSHFLTSWTHTNIDVDKVADISSPLIQDLSSSLLPPSSPDSVKDSVTGSFEMLQHDYKDPGDTLITGDSDTSFRSIYSAGNAYKWYFLLGGGIFGVIGFFVLCIFEQGGFVLCEWWLAYWSENFQSHNESSVINVTMFGPAIWILDEKVYIYLGLVFFTVLLSFIQAGFFFWLANRAAEVLHNLALTSILEAPMAFFDINSPGGVLSRFLRDVGIVDTMPPILLDCIQSFSLLIATVIVVGGTNYWLLLLVTPLTIAFIVARHYFHQSTQDVEKIELASKSAVGGHIISSMEGIQTLRAFGVEQRFLHNFDVSQDRSTAACYLHLAANRWFGMRVDIIAFLVVVGVTIGAILVVQYQGVWMPSSLVGLSLFYALNLLNVQHPAMRKSAAVHFKMKSAERLLQYYQMSPELDVAVDTEVKPSLMWPQYGIITLEGVSVSHPGKGPSPLKGVWCCIRAEEKMGIMFKTAAEQKAFMSVLFRLHDYVGVVRIDGIDIVNVSLQRLRDKIAVIQQNPTLFTGTLRQNLDPISRYTDAQVWRVLEEVNLSSFVETLPQRLYADITTVIDSFSTGHRQLLRLARAMLRQSKIVVYEEPTTSLDYRCNTIIQKLLRTKFEHCTLIHIAHLPDTVIDTDRVMVISEGKIQEVESPHILLQNRNSKFFRLTDELGMFELHRLKKLAQDKYENKPYIAPNINPEDFEEGASSRNQLRHPNNLNVLPTFHSSRLVGVLNQLPTNKFSTNRL
ncbi:ATP-binding cassette sub-family C member 4-like isoform X1 [Haliotis asinina]|uniref:ATP-binding cassette sub-family C member 4-like isoform X1 n=1 Tax=Haliotis asinina TaxID=109174 RepID=UPI0035324E1F